MTEIESLLEEVVDAMNTGVAIYDRTGHFVYANKMGTEMLGLDSEPIADVAIWNIDPEIEHTDFSDYWNSFEHGETRVTETSLLCSETKTPVEIQTTCEAIDGDTYHLCTIQSIREDSEHRLGYEQFSQAVEASGHAIFITEPDGTILYVNSAFEEITGYAKEEALGKDPNILASGEMSEEYYTQFWETILAGNQWEGTVLNRRKSGEFYHANQTVSPILDANETVEGFVAVQDDITEHIERERTLSMLGRVFRHTLRNKLNVIMSHAESASAETPEHIERCREGILESVDALVETANKGNTLVSFLSSETYCQRIDLAQVVPTIITSFRREHPDVEVSADIPNTAQVVALEQIRRALEEVIENSIEHNDAERVTVDVSIENVHDKCRLQVRDNAPPIPEMEQLVLDGAENTDQLYHASGLGLWLVYWIVRRSGGTITVGNREPRGNIVTITLNKPTEESTE
jgi:PAS domain S-box-containing protein